MVEYMLHSVAQVAQHWSVSPGRVHQLIAAGKIEAHLVGSQYVIESTQLAHRPNLTRPMSERMAWAFIAMLSGQEPIGISPSEKSRLRSKLKKLHSEDRPADLLRSWACERAKRLVLRVADTGVKALQNDDRLMLSGVCDPRAGLSAGHWCEAYVNPRQLEQVRNLHLPVEDPHPNVVLHVTEQVLAGSPSVGLVMADLADWQGAREDAQVKRLLEDWFLQ